MNIDLAGQTAIVTGAGADIGRACALALADCGASVVVNDLNPDRVDHITQLIQTRGGRALGWQADVSNRFQVGSLIEGARDAFGRIHILINAAGAYKGGPLSQLDEWDWRRLLDVNLTGAFFCSQLLGRVMAAEGGGVILNIAATAGNPNPLPEGAGYIASKSGLIGLTRQCAREFAPLGIRVNALCPGKLALDNTPSTEQSAVTAEDVAAVAAFLCSESARAIVGQAIHVDGGEGLMLQ